MLTLLAELQPINFLTQILAVICGLAVMAGSLIGYKKLDVEGEFAAIVSILGFLLIAYGLGGVQLIQSFTK